MRFGADDEVRLVVKENLMTSFRCLVQAYWRVVEWHVVDRPELVGSRSD